MTIKSMTAILMLILLALLILFFGMLVISGLSKASYLDQLLLGLFIYTLYRGIRVLPRVFRKIRVTAYFLHKQPWFVPLLSISTCLYATGMIAMTYTSYWSEATLLFPYRFLLMRCGLHGFAISYGVLFLYAMRHLVPHPRRYVAVYKKILSAPALESKEEENEIIGHA